MNSTAIAQTNEFSTNCFACEVVLLVVKKNVLGVGRVKELFCKGRCLALFNQSIPQEVGRSAFSLPICLSTRSQPTYLVSTPCLQPPR